MNIEIPKQSSYADYFSSPEEAIPIITDLLKKKDFKTLAGYYDLSDSGLEPADLESADFFLEKVQPELAHPAGLWPYKHPFPPGFKFSGMTQMPGEHVYLIQVEIRIDQGEGSPVQVGIDSFYMIKSAKGWKIAADRVEDKGKQALPSLAQEPLPVPAWMKKTDS